MSCLAAKPVAKWTVALTLALAALLGPGCVRFDFRPHRDSTSTSDGTPAPDTAAPKPDTAAPKPDAAIPLRVEQVTAGGYHTCAVLSDGTIRCWGDGGSGQLGYGNTTTIGDNETPNTVGAVMVGGPAVQVLAGNLVDFTPTVSHTCALLATGRLRCWGGGLFGRLGYGNGNDIGDNELPASAGDVSLGPALVTGFATGEAATCAVLADGTVRCWGWGGDGRLGNGTTQGIGDDETPAGQAVVLGGPAKAVAGTWAHFCAVMSSGTLRCWGAGAKGRLGYGNTNNVGDASTSTPAMAGDVPVLAAGESVQQVVGAAWHTCAIILPSRAVRCWGLGLNGRLGYGNGNGSDIGDNETPLSAGNVPLGGPAQELAAGADHTCAVLTDGTLRCWGVAAAGQLGYGNVNIIGDDETPASVGPVPLPASIPVLHVTAGRHHTCALLATHQLYCWGGSSQGQLGYGNTNTLGDNEPASAGGPVPVF